MLYLSKGPGTALFGQIWERDLMERVQTQKQYVLKEPTPLVKGQGPELYSS